MKFLIPNYCPPDSFVDNVSFTLRAMGHEVVNLGPVSTSSMHSPYRRLWESLIGKLKGEEKTNQEKWLLRHYREIKPDIVLTLTQALSEETLHVLKKNNIKTVVWWGDTAANMKGRGLLVEGWDLIFIKDVYAANKLKTIGLPAFQLFEAMNPTWHKPLSSQKNNKVVIAGNFYDYRHYLVRKLLTDKIDISLYGNKFPRWADKELSSLHTGKYIVKEEKSRVFGEGLTVLNSTAMREFDSVNCRAFEAAGCGALQIMEYRNSILNCFEPDKEIVLFRSYDELLSQIERALKFPDDMRKIREAAARRALAEHTYQHRLEIILRKIQQL